jgi:hypothetical protein
MVNQSLDIFSELFFRQPQYLTSWLLDHILLAPQLCVAGLFRQSRQPGVCQVRSWALEARSRTTCKTSPVLGSCKQREVYMMYRTAFDIPGMSTEDPDRAMPGYLGTLCIAKHQQRE